MSLLVTEPSFEEEKPKKIFFYSLCIPKESKSPSSVSEMGTQSRRSSNQLYEYLNRNNILSIYSHYPIEKRLTVISTTLL